MSQPDPTTHFKICPRCQTKTNLMATTCTVCGRKFNTQYSSSPAPVPSPPQVHPQPVTPPPLRPAPFTPPSNLVAPSPTGSNYLLDEITRQYNGLINWQTAGTFCLLSGPLMLFAWMGAAAIAPGPMILLAGTLALIGLLFPLLIGFLSFLSIGGLIYALVQKPNLSRQIAQMGMDSRAWSQRMEQRYWRTVKIGIGIMVALALFLLFTLLAVAQAGNVSLSRPDSRSVARMLSAIRPGMTKAEVERLFGPAPDSTYNRYVLVPGGMGMQFLYPAQDGSLVVVYGQDSRVYQYERR